MLGPPLFVLIAAIAAIVLYARAITLGVGWTKCFLRRPTYIVGFWCSSSPSRTPIGSSFSGSLADRLTALADAVASTPRARGLDV